MSSKVLFNSPKVTIVCVSDTHNEMPTDQVPDADIFIHAGDLSNKGTPAEIKAVYHWIAALPHKVKIIVPGNNDRCLCPHHPTYDADSVALFTANGLPRNNNIYYLCDTVCTVANYRTQSGTIRPINVYGNPAQPDYLADLGAKFANPFGFAYPPYPSSASRVAWANAPTRAIPISEAEIGAAQIWVTHSPPKGRLDSAPSESHPETGEEVKIGGCELLLKRIAQARPFLHVFGHLHGGCGVETVTWDPKEHVVMDTQLLAKQNNEVGSCDDATRRFDFVEREPLNRRTSVLVNAAWMPVDRKNVSRRNMPWFIKMDLDARG